MTEDSWIQTLIEDSNNQLLIAADWFEEQNDEACNLLRWMAKRLELGIIESWRDTKNIGPRTYIALSQEVYYYWWMEPLETIMPYHPPCGLPFEIDPIIKKFYASSDFSSEAEAWKWAFERWRIAYKEGKLKDRYPYNRDEFKAVESRPTVPI